MTFLHLADLHLGKSVNDFSMIEDQKQMLSQITQIAAQKKPDCILIAGDVYDRAVPSEEAVRLLDSFLSDLAALQIRVFLISGNHDSDVRLQYAGTLLRKNGIYIAGCYEGLVECVTLEDAYGPVEVHMLPFVKASLVRHFYPDEDTDTYDAAVRTALKHVARVDDAISKEESKPEHEETAQPEMHAGTHARGCLPRKILLAHQFVTSDGADPEAGGSEDGILNVGTIEKVGSSCFDGYDYVALGHIHRAQRVGRDCVRYSGSPLKYSLSEVGQEKSMPYVTLHADGSCGIELVPLVPKRDMRHLKGPLAMLLAPEHIQDPEDYIYVTLTDENVQYEAMSRIREHYPNVMKLDYENEHVRQLRAQEVTGDVSEIPFAELVEGFFCQIEGRDPTEEELGILASMWKNE